MLHVSLPTETIVPLHFSLRKLSVKARDKIDDSGLRKTWVVIM